MMEMVQVTVMAMMDPKQKMIAGRTLERSQTSKE